MNPQQYRQSWRKAIAVLFVLAMPLASVYAQGDNGIAQHFHDNMYTFDGLQKIEAADFFSRYQEDLGLSNDDSFQEQECQVHENGKFDCRYLQYYKGYPVDGSSFVLHGEKGIVFYAGGNQIQGLNVNTDNPISESDALQAIINHFPNATFMWQEEESENALKEMADNPDATRFPKGQLVLAKPQNSDFAASEYKLTWKFFIDIVAPEAQSVTVYVDALDSSIFSSFDRMDHGHYGTGSVYAEYDGWRNFRTWKCDACTRWKLRSDKNIYSFEGDSGILRDRDNNWSDWGERPVTTTHWATEEAWEYFFYRHGRWGSNNSGMRLDNHVGTSYPGRYAAYNQSAGVDNIYVGYRDNGVTPAALDILGHEYSHAFIRRNPNLNPYFQNIEAGALNEGFADIFGLLVERDVRGNGHNWKIGEDVGFSSPTVRNFADPHASLSSGQPVRYQESGYWDWSNANKHNNAGVLTHWFYILSEGQGPFIQGVGIERADDIAFITMMWWLWGTVNFHDTRNQSMAAAKYHYGECSKEHKATMRAWTAVGVGTNDVRCWPKVIAGTNVLDQMHLGAAAIGYHFGIISTDEDSNEPLSSSDVQWILPTGWTTAVDEDNLGFTVTAAETNESQTIRAIIQQGDVADTVERIVHVVDCATGNCEPLQSRVNTSVSMPSPEASGSALFVYPNPVSHHTTNLLVQNYAEGGDYHLEVFNMDGQQVYSQELSSKLSIIPTSDLSSGVYLFTVTHNAHSETIRVVINN